VINNQMTNKGTDPWTRDGGLLSIWILGISLQEIRTALP
jgi:hypothetical protein